jgi:hypothetical protein
MIYYYYANSRQKESDITIYIALSNTSVCFNRFHYEVPVFFCTSQPAFKVLATVAGTMKQTSRHWQRSLNVTHELTSRFTLSLATVAGTMKQTSRHWQRSLNVTHELTSRFTLSNVLYSIFIPKFDSNIGFLCWGDIILVFLLLHTIKYDQIYD